MRFASICSGIEAASCAWNPLGWEAAWFSEIEKFPCALLSHHYPETPNLGDMLKIREDQIGNFDVLVGGTPCQSFSIAGLRGGLDDARGNLALRFFQLAGIARPRWVVWENVPGVLSSGGGRDFGSIVGALAKLGYGWAYRILDAQYFGVAQRRRRVFLVGHLGDWRCAAAVLFERQSLRFNSAPSWPKEEIYGFDSRVSKNFHMPHLRGYSPCLIKTRGHAIAHRNAVRLMTPMEHERVQGFPDDYTLIPFRGKPASDGPRYQALGNSMAVPVMRWIGERIDMVDNLKREPRPLEISGKNPD